MNIPLLPADFEYVIMPPRFCDEKHLDLLSRTYAFWRDGWTKVYRENGSQDVPNPQDFFRQDLVTVLSHKGTVAAIHFYSFYDFRSDLVMELPYMSAHFNLEFVHECRKMGFRRMLGMESLLANPDYRKSQTGISLTELVPSLGLRLFAELTDADCAFSPTRADNKTSVNAQRLGFRPLLGGRVAHNTAIDFLICRKGDVVPPGEPVRLFFEQIWRSREIGSQVSNLLKKAG